ncbi:hypothetical protein M8845_17240 [Gelidibacter japonicus]|jgi:hypothetical protein|uniref:hypothetical protein n=1 Tax=Gelidibacter japonicus TaxID=1962232 RepID=UPI0020200BF4|nr:hypothetical protein [Gelidibacter japonicus]MCL8009176.1 hypothetical protein [Gelidibacter japonicus]
MKLEDFKLYLPKFLSAESEKELFDGLKDFPNNIDTRLYSNYLTETDIIFQGDGISDMLYVNLPNPDIKPVPSMILSNTCDIDIHNVRNFPSQVVYAPIFNLTKYQDALYNKSEKTKEQIDSHIQSIKNQEITQIFYLPEVDSKIKDSIVFFDRVCNLPNKSISRDNLKEKRLFTLSDYGAYLFILKMSIHFTRIQDKVERKSVNL